MNKLQKETFDWISKMRYKCSDSFKVNGYVPYLIWWCVKAVCRDDSDAEHKITRKSPHVWTWSDHNWAWTIQFFSWKKLGNWITTQRLTISETRSVSSKCLNQYTACGVLFDSDDAVSWPGQNHDAVKKRTILFLKNLLFLRIFSSRC